MGQLYGGPSTNHPLLKGDGLIFSSGPFSGYLAIVLPVCLNLALRFRDCDKLAWWETRTMLFYLSAFTITLILIGLPGGKAIRRGWQPESHAAGSSISGNQGGSY